MDQGEHRLSRSLSSLHACNLAMRCACACRSSAISQIESTCNTASRCRWICMRVQSTVRVYQSSMAGTFYMSSQLPGTMQRWIRTLPPPRTSERSQKFRVGIGIGAHASSSVSFSLSFLHRVVKSEHIIEHTHLIVNLSTLLQASTLSSSSRVPALSSTSRKDSSRKHSICINRRV